MATRQPAKKTARPAAKRPAAKTRKASARRAKPAAKSTAKPAAKAATVARLPKDRRKPETLRVRSIAPGITADDLARSTRFYTDVLGFLVSERWTDSRGALRGVMLKAGACEIGLSQDDWAKGRNRAKGVGMRLWCETGQDIDELAARIRAAGGKLSEEPTTQAWGARSLSVIDPDGIHLTIFREE
jgi:catechol 2,3-dioxygenase-like lactoylglutathione lyase family enzyme